MSPESIERKGVRSDKRQEEEEEEEMVLTLMLELIRATSALISIGHLVLGKFRTLD